MTLPPIWSPNQGSGAWWNSQEKGILITIQPSHCREMFVDNAITSSHQSRIVALKFSLEAQKKKIKRNKAKNTRQ
jgi:hypothetical protein